MKKLIKFIKGLFGGNTIKAYQVVNKGNFPASWDTDGSGLAIFLNYLGAEEWKEHLDDYACSDDELVKIIEIKIQLKTTATLPYRNVT